MTASSMIRLIVAESPRLVFLGTSRNSSLFFSALFCSLVALSSPAIVEVARRLEGGYQRPGNFERLGLGWVSLGLGLEFVGCGLTPTYR